MPRKKLGKPLPLPDDDALLPSASEREELIFAFDTAAFDFRGAVLAMFREAFTDEEMALPTDAQPPGERPGAGPADSDTDGTLLSNLHRTAVRVACSRLRRGSSGSAGPQMRNDVGASGRTVASRSRRHEAAAVTWSRRA